jgi:hypothetical protein
LIVTYDRQNIFIIQAIGYKQPLVGNDKMNPGLSFLTLKTLSLYLMNGTCQVQICQKYMVLKEAVSCPMGVNKS